jgi:hypothetical protein
MESLSGGHPFEIVFRLARDEAGLTVIIDMPNPDTSLTMSAIGKT